MNKKIMKSLIIFGLVIIINLISTTISNASLNISSKSEVSPGENFSVTVSVSSSEAGAVNLSVSNGTLSSSYIDLMSQSSVTISCTAGNSGTVSISASGKVANYTPPETEGTQTSSKSVLIKQPVVTPTPTPTPKPTTTTETKKSSDSTLSAFSITEGILAPEFNKDIREYTLNVANEVTGLTVNATPTNTKAITNITGNTDLQVGENTLKVVVTAEDGSTSNYIVKVTREREKVALKTLTIKYINTNGETIEVPLTPKFLSNVYEYTLEEIPYTVNNFIIDAVSNLEGVTIDIKGNENLKEGENVITIVVTLPAAPVEGELAEGEAQPKDEVVTYTMKFNKQIAPIPPTFMGKVSDWFKGMLGTVSNWYVNNSKPIVVYSLCFCIVAMFGLSIYIIIDYKRYKMLLSKISKLIPNINVDVEVVESSLQSNIEEEQIEEDNNIKEIEQTEEQIENNENKKAGRHF